jgi:hypothetical protein
MIHEDHPKMEFTRKSRFLLIAWMGSTFVLSATAIVETTTPSPEQPDKLNVASAEGQTVVASDGHGQRRQNLQG